LGSKLGDTYEGKILAFLFNVVLVEREERESPVLPMGWT
jgi:hypothetical protein